MTAAGTTATAQPSPDGAARVSAGEVVRRLRAVDTRRGVLAVAGLGAVLVVLVGASLLLGDVRVPVADVLSALRGEPGPAAFIVTGLRLPRAMLGAVVGALLGMSGALLQSVVRNPLASPDVVGVTGGASAAAVLAIGAGAVGAGVDVAALGGALGAAALVVALSGRGVLGTRFVVVGVAVAFAATAVLGYALTRANLTAARSAYRWLVGSVGTAAWSDVARLAAVLAAVSLLLAIARRPLAALRLDDAAARGLGLQPERVRTAAVAGSAVLAAAAVAAAGPVAFVAFVSGPLARRLRGHGPALATAALVGATAVVTADLVAQHLPGSLQPPVGLVTGALGAPFLLWVLWREA
ncbi:iron ABC transporter permease [Actinotalea sp. M2MS4P-6]|uniref:FecCD family ABC transporter permease n=1 Tax=Actinotalea sp. M2MS4P-6 TaxID=2983762 RepID=UPI0021E48FAC|nr:iron ABC transporter permease [Actinotalea sp. M2MS4P-6]MCV2393609.1 iron ABC transporter permease [Actinotalea sp. M2MS4P-6]